MNWRCSDLITGVDEKTKTISGVIDLDKIDETEKPNQIFNRKKPNLIGSFSFFQLL